MRRRKDKMVIELGKKYRDTVTGYEGVAVAITHYLHMCERAALSTLVEGKPEEYYFDAPGLELVEDKPVVKEPKAKTGGYHTPPRRTY